MKYKHLIALFLMGLLLDITGSFFKIMHFQLGPVTGNLLLAAGMSAKALSVILLLFKILKNKEQNTFLNR